MLSDVVVRGRKYSTGSSAGEKVKNQSYSNILMLFFQALQIYILFISYQLWSFQFIMCMVLFVMQQVSLNSIYLQLNFCNNNILLHHTIPREKLHQGYSKSEIIQITVVVFGTMFLNCLSSPLDYVGNISPLSKSSGIRKTENIMLQFLLIILLNTSALHRIIVYHYHAFF